MARGSEIVSLVSDRQDRDQFRRKNWIGTFEQYLDIVAENPLVTRTAYQRLYDMILSYGVDVEEKGREKHYRYRFFEDPDNAGRDAVFGLRKPLHNLVNALKSAAHEYGIEKRVLLLHGPVGSSKSTIVRLLKQGLQRYSTTDDGALYTLGWVDEENPEEVHWCPMNEEPLHLIPMRFRPDVEAQLNAGRGEDDFKVRIRGELDPFCRFMYHNRLKKYDGDWTRVVQDVRIKRLLLSEKDRIGIGTFQPKDEKNQDATELTGDIN
ncbi:MAG: serine protein kinase, partial [Planctomycetales bacterium]|nr:serine protein kinase [Planctomycetales bacterium]